MDSLTQIRYGSPSHPDRGVYAASMSVWIDGGISETESLNNLSLKRPPAVAPQWRKGHDLKLKRSALLLRTLQIGGIAFAIATLAARVNHGQPFSQGNVSPNFTLTNREDGANINLTDFEGKIVVLDFFAYWCAPCSVSSPDIEKNIQEFYADRGGNPHGVPVQVLAVNLEPEAPENTDAFVKSAGLDLVVNDFENKVWDLYNLLGNRPSIPLFVIVNGVANSPNHKQWEVLHSQHGMYILPNETTANLFRSFIDRVEPGPKATESALNPFETARREHRGWKLSEWFGRINDTYFPWVFHKDHSWLFVARQSTEQEFHFYDSVLGWLYTSREAYPRVYSFDRTAWLYFDDTDADSRSVFDYNTRTWIDIASTTKGNASPSKARLPIFSPPKNPIQRFE